MKYVGDAACVRCHAEIAETYRQHPMGQSLVPDRGRGLAGADHGQNPPSSSRTDWSIPLNTGETG